PQVLANLRVRCSAVGRIGKSRVTIGDKPGGWLQPSVDLDRPGLRRCGGRRQRDEKDNQEIIQKSLEHDRAPSSSLPVSSFSSFIIGELAERQRHLPQKNADEKHRYQRNRRRSSYDRRENPNPRIEDHHQRRNTNLLQGLG